MTDLVSFGESMLRLTPPDDDRLERTDSFEIHIAGAESNVAVAAQRLGVDTTWISKLPDSAVARRLVRPLASHGVDADVVWTEDGRQGLYYLETGGEPRGLNVVYDRAGAAVTTAETSELPTERVRDARMFYTTGITPALSSTLETTTRELLEIARDAGTTTGFDLNYRSKLWSPAEARTTLTNLFPLVDVAVIPEDDAEQVLGREGGGERLARDLQEEYGFETVVVTRGGEGALALEDGAVHEQGAYETETVDRVGTGDAFVGGFLAQYLDDAPIPAALEYGAATAALKRTIPGDVAVVTSGEVEAVIARGGQDISR
ncbi:MAG: bifunctional 2-dehydro-3-deoxygluconokinase/2-dehydro-3-deoxygalactonokinase [Halobacteriales archaeon]